MTGVLTSPLNHEIFVSRITPVEIVSAISRRARDGSIKGDEARDASAAFRADLPTLYQIVELTDNVIVRAMGLSEDHALRAYDAVQLAGALEVNAQFVERGFAALTFVSSDKELNAVAARNGLSVEDPNTRS